MRGILGHVNIDVTQNQELGFTRGQSPASPFGLSLSRIPSWEQLLTFFVDGRSNYRLYDVRE